LERVSPWVDHLGRSVHELKDVLDAQQHRRFLKTHTPLDGLPDRDDVLYVVVGRDPRDVAISMEHHVANFDAERFLEVRANAVGLEDLADLPPRQAPSEDPVERFRTFVISDELGGLVTLSSLLRHLATGWERRSSPKVALFHYADYCADLPGELTRLGSALGIEVAAERATALAAEASLSRMRERAEEVVPNASLGTWKNTQAFLRAGSSGEWRERVTDDDISLYEERVAALAAPDLARWTHEGRLRSGIEP
jgi:hypothetical protein